LDFNTDSILCSAVWLFRSALGTKLESRINPMGAGSFSDLVRWAWLSIAPHAFQYVSSVTRKLPVGKKHTFRLYWHGAIVSAALGFVIAQELGLI
jgi:hypothetical protein